MSIYKGMTIASDSGYATSTSATITGAYYNTAYYNTAYGYNPYVIEPLWDSAMPAVTKRKRKPTFEEKLQTEIDMWLSEFD